MSAESGERDVPLSIRLAPATWEDLTKTAGFKRLYDAACEVSEDEEDEALRQARASERGRCGPAT